MNRPAALGSQIGMTLTELVVVSFILVVLTGLVHTTYRYDIQSFARETSVNATQSTVRIWAIRMEQSIRNACFDASDSSVNPYSISTAQDQDFRFTTGATPSSVGFRLNGSNLELWQGASNWRVVLQNVTLLDFNYYDSQGAALDPASSTFPMASINEVEVTLIAQASASGIPGAPTPVVAQHFRAALRNQCS